MIAKKPCPKCKALNKVVLGKNMLDEEVGIIQCWKCRSLSVCKDGKHWSLVVENNSRNIGT